MRGQTCQSENGVNANAKITNESGELEIGTGFSENKQRMRWARRMASRPAVEC